MSRRVPLAGAIAAVAVTVTGWMVLPAPPPAIPTSDWSRFYRPIGRSLADGRGMVPQDKEVSVVSYPPGYPLLVAASFAVGDRLGMTESQAVRGLNLLCVAISGALIASLAGAAGARRGVAGAVLWSAYPPTLWLTAQPLSEVPFAVLLLASFATWRAALRSGVLRPWLWLAAGTLAGGAALVRPIAAFLGGLLALLAFLPGALERGRFARAQAASLLLAGWVLALVPWQVWSAHRTGAFVFLSSVGTDSMLDGLTWAVRDKGYRSVTSLSPETRAAMEGFGALGESASFAAIAREARRQVAEEPAGLARLLGWKLLRPLWGTDSGRKEPPVAVVNLAVLGLYLVAMRVAPDGETRTTLTAAGAVLVLFWAMSSAVLPIARYLAPPLALISGLLPLALPPRREPRGGEQGRPRAAGPVSMQEPPLQRRSRR